MDNIPIKEYKYFDENGNFLVALGKPIEDIVEENIELDKRVSELETILGNDFNLMCTVHYDEQ